MQFCAAAGRDDDALDKAFSSLSLHTSGQASLNESTETINSTTSDTIHNIHSSKELSTLLLSMRKLREALVATARTDIFSQRAYVFIIRAAILTSTYESYQPALLHLLYRIHTVTPLPIPELHEFVSYYILDLTCRLGDHGKAYSARKRWDFRDTRVEAVIKAIVHDDWVSYWRIRAVVDGYQRKILGWVEDGMRKHALKCIGRTYLTVEKDYVERCAGRSFDELREHDHVGWELEGKMITVRRIRVK